MTARAAIAAALLAAIGVPAHADICRWTDASGAVHYGDHAPPQVAAQCTPTAPAPASWKPKAPHQPAIDDADVDEMIERAHRDLEDVRRSLTPEGQAQARFEATLARARWHRSAAAGQ